jgi:thiol-disulfide isomerase/thioredoxin
MSVKFKPGWSILIVGALLLSAQGIGYGSTKSTGIRPAEVYFYDKYNKKVTLDDFSGNVVLVNIWATWCAPCVAELPSLDRLQSIFSNRKFIVIAVSQDRVSSSDGIKKFLYEKSIKKLGVYWDKDRQFPSKWQYSILPTSVLIDREGYVVKQFTGAFDWGDEALVDEVRAALD